MLMVFSSVGCLWCFLVLFVGDTMVLGVFGWRVFGNLWVFISSGGMWDWVIRIQKYENCNCYFRV